MGTESTTASTDQGTSVVFDGQCPFCRAYVASLKDNDEDLLTKVDARCTPALVEQLATENIDINGGIVLLQGSRLYQGSEALTRLAKQHASPAWFASLPHRLLRYRRLSSLLYPMLRLLRNTYLRLARRPAIETGSK